MNKELSAGGIIFKRDGARILFLVIYSKRNKIWGFPKGRLESGETEKEAARREIKEETGLDDLHLIEGFKEKVMYEIESERAPFKGERIEKYATYFLYETKKQDIIVDGGEISDYVFLPLGGAGGLIRFRNLNKILRKAYDFLQAM